ncbi:MAG TPA: HEAT repeat domain-containing protein [Kofleriaceae bacterium]
MYRVVVLAVALAMIAVMLRATPAFADNVDELVKQLESSSDTVRLSAALNLTKAGDQRGILALAKALNADTNSRVRGAAAAGLSQLITDQTKPSYKNLAISALKRAAESGDAEVKEQASAALTRIGVAGPGPSAGTSGRGGGIYVNIGPMSSKTGDASIDSKLKTLMMKVAAKAMSRSASSMATTWDGGGVPTKAQLDAKNVSGFYVDGTLNEVKVKGDGTISCKVNMLLASYPDKSIFGLLNGGASVQASGGASDIALAREDCVSAVVEDLIAKKIVPTIKTKAASP